MQMHEFEHIIKNTPRNTVGLKFCIRFNTNTTWKAPTTSEPMRHPI